MNLSDIRGLIYLASPYLHPDPAVRHERFQLVCRIAGRMMRRGLHVLSPIAHTHPIAELEDLPKGWDFWRAYDLLLISKCEALAVLQLPGWGESAGVMAEIAIAKDCGIPVFYLPVFIEESC